MHLTDFRGKRIHMIGIGGSSMHGLAELLLHEGYIVTGSDRTQSHLTDKLADMGIPVTIGHFAETVKSAALVVYTAAISPDNPELAACASLGVPTMERSVLLGELSAGYTESIAVCGTHGKTTTTSMLAECLLACGKDPTVHIGGVLPSLGTSVRAGHDSFLTEACEFKESFMTLSPTLIVLLNIDADHLDYYRDLEHIYKTIKKFVGKLRPDGCAVLCADDPLIRRLLNETDRKYVTYGLSQEADYMAKAIEEDELGRYSFDAFKGEEKLGRVMLRVPGRHSASDALAALAACAQLGLSMEKAIHALCGFEGARRRFEKTGVVNGMTLYHDYGHNPTEYRSVIPLAAKLAQKSGGRCIIVSQPHTYSRTKALFQEYLTAFDGANIVLVSDIYAAREKDPGDIHSTQLVEALRKRGVNAIYRPDFDSLESWLRENGKTGDIVLTLGCGNINLLNERMGTDA